MWPGFLPLASPFVCQQWNVCKDAFFTSKNADINLPERWNDCCPLLKDVMIVSFFTGDGPAHAKTSSCECFEQNLHCIFKCFGLIIQSMGNKIWKVMQLIEEAYGCSCCTCTIPWWLGSAFGQNVRYDSGKAKEKVIKMNESAADLGSCILPEFMHQGCSCVQRYARNLLLPPHHLVPILIIKHIRSIVCHWEIDSHFPNSNKS